MKTHPTPIAPTRRLTVSAGLCVVLAVMGLAGARLAEAGPRGHGTGRYEGTHWRIADVKPTGNIWSQFNSGAIGMSVLNPGGDLNGDLWPTVVESPLTPNHPWVVWSRFNGRDYDLAWSRWRGARWSHIQSVHRDLSPGDDLDAALGFDEGGRPYAVWWRNEKGVGRVYMSVYLNSRWMAPFQISDVMKDCRYPTLQVFAGGRIVVEYETQGGLYAQVVQFNQPVTITDDINPFAHVELVGKAMIVRRRRF